MAKVVVIKFKQGGKPYYFNAKKGETYSRNTPVIVETSKGIEFARVVNPEHEVPDEKLVQPLKTIVRIATAKDIEVYESRESKKPQMMKICKEKIDKYQLDMKLVDCEYSFDGSQITFHFSAPERVDFRDLVKDLASTFHARIELHQINPRDEAKYIGGIAPCGRVCCCASNMTEAKHVSIKMAKSQGLTISPGKVNGMCGKLMCCLAYESEYYADAFAKMPKINSDVGTPEGRGKVASVNMLKMTVKVKIDDGNGGLLYRDFPVDQLKFKRSCPMKDEEE